MFVWQPFLDLYHTLWKCAKEDSTVWITWCWTLLLKKYLMFLDLSLAQREQCMRYCWQRCVKPQCDLTPMSNSLKPHFCSDNTSHSLSGPLHPLSMLYLLTTWLYASLLRGHTVQLHLLKTFIPSIICGQHIFLSMYRIKSIDVWGELWQ